MQIITIEYNNEFQIQSDSETIDYQEGVTLKFKLVGEVSILPTEQRLEKDTVSGVEIVKSTLNVEKALFTFPIKTDNIKSVLENLVLHSYVKLTAADGRIFEAVEPVSTTSEYQSGTNLHNVKLTVPFAISRSEETTNVITSTIEAL